MARLDGKMALITAAGQGTGRATALRCADEGAIVWATEINGRDLDALCWRKAELSLSLQSRNVSVIEGIISRGGTLR